jgi:hypothetical protein
MIAKSSKTRPLLLRELATAVDEVTIAMRPNNQEAVTLLDSVTTQVARTAISEMFFIASSRYCAAGKLSFTYFLLSDFIYCGELQ